MTATFAMTQTQINQLREMPIKNFKVFPEKCLVGGADFETFITVDGAIQFIHRVFDVPPLHHIKERIKCVVKGEDNQNKIFELIIKIKFLKLRTFALLDEEFSFLEKLLYLTVLWCHNHYLEYVNETFYEPLEEHYFENKENMGDGDYLDAMNWLMKHKQLDVAFSKIESLEDILIGASISDKTYYIAICF